MKLSINLIFFLFTFSLLQLLGQCAQAKKLSFIRDAETEAGIQTLIKPILNAAGLESNAVKLYIVKDPTLNAFVAGGPNIFIHTGLLSASRNASELLAVLAHEIGHISGGHLSKLFNAQKNASNRAILGTLLGGVAAVLTKNPSAGSAIISGGQHVGIRSLLRFTREQELSADRAALRYLDASGQTARGMLTFMSLINDQELLSISNQDPYVRTHPPSQERMTYLQNHIRNSPYSASKTNKLFQTIHSRIKAKITAFLQSPSKTFREYPSSNTSASSRYAQAIAFYRSPELDSALRIIDELIDEFPQDPYFHELKGQILFENGYPKKALSFYEKTVKLLPDTALIRADLGRVQLAQNDQKLLHDAISNFQFSLNKEPRRSFVWRQLGIAFGRLNMMGKSSRALAEEALLKGLNKEAIRLAKRAQNVLAVNSPDWIRAEDIIITAKNKEGKR